jgi:hypothetical protein
VARLFLVDFCGASLSALMSWFVLPIFADLLGVAATTLRLLATVAIGLALVDAVYLALRPRRWRAMVRAVALGNLAYPLLALALSAADGVSIAALGAALLGVESLVVVVLGGLQLHAARGART